MDVVRFWDVIEDLLALLDELVIEINLFLCLFRADDTFIRIFAELLRIVV